MRRIGWTKVLAAVGLVGMCAGVGMGQGDPARAFSANTAAARAAGTKVRVDLIGDSTQTDHAGYGRGFCANLTGAVDCLNLAKGGASTKTFREQRLWEHGLATKPDYMLIQFGHNDLQGGDHNPRQTTMAEYEANLRRYVTEARAAGIKPVLVTPLTRRYFEADGMVHSDLLGHAATMKKVAVEMKVPVIDLQAESIAYLDGIGEAKGSTLGISKKDAAGKTVADKTHLNWAGSYVFGRMVAVGLARVEPELAKYVHAKAAALPPEGVKAMKVLEGGPVKIVLVGDSTVNAGGGWGRAFCETVTVNVTCVNEALNGRSSKSFIDEGAWAKSLTDKGDYYLIQFGHNDQKPDAARHTDPETTYIETMRRYIQDVRAIGAVPVVVTSLSRRTYKNGKVVEDLNAYAAAARRVAAEEYVTLIDLNAMSTKLLNTMTQAEADGFDAEVHPDAQAAAAVGVSTAASKLDRTHLNAKGQAVFGRMVADALVKTEVELGPDVMGVAAK